MEVKLRQVSVKDAKLQRGDPVDEDTLTKANAIVSAVQKGGEKTLLEYAVTFGDLKQASDPYVLTRQELKEAYDSLTPRQQNLLQRTATRIRNFAEAQRRSISEMSISVPGGVAGHTVAPVQIAGCYAPGGRFPLPSSVLMTAVTARAAGVKQVWVASPRPVLITKAAAFVADADGLVCIGGAQAIAALAFGVGKVPACDVIVGPGNRWVTAAKKLVSGRVGIDMLAGPSELLVLADHTADPDTIAADLLAQAEHDVVARPYLVTTDPLLLPKVEAALATRLAALPTKDIAAEAVKGGFCVVCEDMETAISVADHIAPEHLEVLTKDSKEIAKKLQNYGGIFIGQQSAEVLGDYGVGPNHTLPTSGTARFAAGLSVFHFLRIRTWLHMDPVDIKGTAGQEVVRDAIDLALVEGLHGHAASAEKRFLKEEKGHDKTEVKSKGRKRERSEEELKKKGEKSKRVQGSKKLKDETKDDPKDTTDVTAWIRSDFASLTEYTPVRPLEVLAKEIGMPIPQLAKLNANENLYGPFPDAIKAIRTANHHIYPDPDQNALREATAKAIGFDPSEIVYGCGSDELIDVIIRLSAPKIVLTSGPTFSMYKFLGEQYGCKYVDIARGPAPHFKLPLSELCTEIQHHPTKTIVFLASPNNPTGTLVSNDEISVLCQQNALVVIDEAYAEFANSSCLPLLRKFPNLLVLRTFSKWAGLAGLRVGYLVAHSQFCKRIMQIKQPYNINVAAEVAALSSLLNREQILVAAQVMRVERARLMVRLAEFAWLKPLPSQANFMLVEVLGAPPRALEAYLKKKGILVRCYAGGHDRVLDKYIRISCGRPSDTDRLLEALHEIDQSSKSMRMGSSSDPLSSLQNAGNHHSTPFLSKLGLNWRPACILFDMDGVLAEVSSSYRQAIIKTAEFYGVKVSNEDINQAKRKGNANNDWELTERLIKGSTDFKSEKTITFDQIKARFQAYYNGIDGKNGLRDTESLLIDKELLAELSKNYPLAIVTGRPRAEAEYFLKLHQIHSFFPILVTMEDGPAKPNPKPVLLALERLKIPQKDSSQFCYFIGDTRDDMLAAVRATEQFRLASSPFTVIGLGYTPPGQETDVNIESLYSSGAVQVLISKFGFQQFKILALVEPSQRSNYCVYRGFQKKEKKEKKFRAMEISSFSDFEREEKRYAQINRVTKETNVSCEVSLDGTGESTVDTGIGFLDHMISALSKHSRIDLKLTCKGDLYIDDHHTTEDVCLTLGETINKALGDKKGIVRFGSAYAPLDESLSRAVVDISGRPHSEIALHFQRPMIGQVSTEMLEHALRSFATSAKITLHVEVLKGQNDHHRAESAFKALALALKNAIQISSHLDIPSTKGVL